MSSLNGSPTRASPSDRLSGNRLFRRDGSVPANHRQQKTMSESRTPEIRNRPPIPFPALRRFIWIWKDSPGTRKPIPAPLSIWRIWSWIPTMCFPRSPGNLRRNTSSARASDTAHEGRHPGQGPGIPHAISQWRFFRMRSRVRAGIFSALSRRRASPPVWSIRTLFGS